MNKSLIIDEITNSNIELLKKVTQQNTANKAIWRLIDWFCDFCKIAPDNEIVQIIIANCLVPRQERDKLKIELKKLQKWENVINVNK